MKFVQYVLIVLLLCSSFFMSPSISAQQTFKDVSIKHSNYADIEWAVSKGLLKGYSDNTFRPSNYLTESQFAKIFTRYASPTTLQDVETAKENTTVYQYFKEQGILLPGHTKTSAINKQFTRIQVAKVFYHYYEGKAAPSNTVAIDWMYAKGLTTGKGVSTDKYKDFGSNDPLKRAHISAFFNRFDKVLNAEPLNEQQIVDKIIATELGTKFELIQFDRINLTNAVEDEYFIYLRDKHASLVDFADNIYIVAAYDSSLNQMKVLKKWSDTSEFSFLERVEMNENEQMIVWANVGSDLQLALTVVAANSIGSINATPITKVYKNGAFTINGSYLYIEGDTYRLVNGKLQ